MSDAEQGYGLIWAADNLEQAAARLYEGGSPVEKVTADCLRFKAREFRAASKLQSPPVEEKIGIADVVRFAEQCDREKR